MTLALLCEKKRERQIHKGEMEVASYVSVATDGRDYGEMSVFKSTFPHEYTGVLTARALTLGTVERGLK